MISILFPYALLPHYSPSMAGGPRAMRLRRDPDIRGTYDYRRYTPDGMFMVRDRWCPDETGNFIPAKWTALYYDHSGKIMARRPLSTLAGLGQVMADMAPPCSPVLPIDRPVLVTMDPLLGIPVLAVHPCMDRKFQSLRTEFDVCQSLFGGLSRLHEVLVLKGLYVNDFRTFYRQSCSPKKQHTITMAMARRALLEDLDLTGSPDQVLQCREPLDLARYREEWAALLRQRGRIK